MDVGNNATIDTMSINEHQQLLRDLKAIVESLLISRVDNVWNVYGGLNRLHTAVENIFKHQCKVLKSDVSMRHCVNRLYLGQLFLAQYTRTNFSCTFTFFAMSIVDITAYTTD